MNIGENIRSLRLSRGLTQEQLGERLGVQKSAIQKYETGSISNIKPETVMKICGVFDVSPSVLMGWRGCSPRKESSIIFDEVCKAFGDEAALVIEVMDQLNHDGREAVVRIVKDYSCIEKYRN